MVLQWLQCNLYNDVWTVMINYADCLNTRYTCFIYRFKVLKVFTCILNYPNNLLQIIDYSLVFTTMYLNRQTWGTKTSGIPIIPVLILYENHDISYLSYLSQWLTKNSELSSWTGIEPHRMSPNTLYKTLCWLFVTPSQGMPSLIVQVSPFSFYINCIPFSVTAPNSPFLAIHLIIFCHAPEIFQTST